MTKKGWIITGSIIAVLATGGILIYKNKKKKKEEEAANNEIPSTTTTKTSDIVYFEIGTDRTKKLQAKLNEFIQSGALGEVLGWLGFSLPSWDTVKSAAIAVFAPGVAISNAIDDSKHKAAIEQFRTEIQPALKNGKLAVDGLYGNNTMAVVKALQIYLNGVKNAGLIVDGKYGTKTDSATGWGIWS